jgi:hypothetical protein
MFARLRAGENAGIHGQRPYKPAARVFSIADPGRALHLHGSRPSLASGRKSVQRVGDMVISGYARGQMTSLATVPRGQMASPARFRRDGGQVGPGVDDPVKGGGRGAAAERRTPGRRIHQDAAQGEHVSSRPGGQALGLLR